MVAPSECRGGTAPVPTLWMEGNDVPNDNWLFRARYRDDDATTTPHIFIRLFGLQPVPPGGVLQIEWGRPLKEDNDTTDTACNPGPNVFCTGREGFNSTDLDQHMALAVFARTANNTPPTLESGTMLCYFVQGDLNYTGEGMTKALIGHDKAVASKLLALVNNPVRGSRTLIIRARADGSLAASTATSGPEFSAPVALGLKAQFAPAVIVDAPGNEHYLIRREYEAVPRSPDR